MKMKIDPIFVLITHLGFIANYAVHSLPK